jgi:hypothetical protein
MEPSPPQVQPNPKAAENNEAPIYVYPDYHPGKVDAPAVAAPFSDTHKRYDGRHHSAK